jgi:protein-S-isoprenylcysteine O-methyltransferase Ste14
MVLGGFFAFCAGTYLQGTIASVEGLNVHHLTLVHAANIASIFAMMTFMGLVAYLYAVQLPPTTKFAGWRPALVACVGSFAMLGLLLLEARVDLSPQARLSSAALIVTGNLFAIYALRHLHRSFSILPQARSLVTGGPYRFIRHPLYLAEAVSTFGVLLNFLSPEAVILFGVQLFCQLRRMNYEEDVLSAAFPEYRDYRVRTARLLPGLY